MTESKPSEWAQACFGDAATELAQAVSRAIYQAHEQALAAHLNGRLQSNDAYGSTMYPAVNEQLAAECKDIPGVQLRKPRDARSRYDLVVCQQPPVVVYPWRYATDNSMTRERARFRRPVSDLRKTLLALSGGSVSNQLTLEQGARDPGELEAELAEDQAVLDQLRELGQVVTIGFASNPGGVFELGWGDVELLDERSGRVRWRYWEPLPPPGDQASGGERRGPLSPAADDGNSQKARFDQAMPEDDLGLRLRPPLAEPLISEPERLQKDTGSGQA